MNLNNGQINYNGSPLANQGYPVKTVASFTCNDGYFLMGSDSTTCQTSGNWNHNTPSCGKLMSNSCTQLSFPLQVKNVQFELEEIRITTTILKWHNTFQNNCWQGFEKIINAVTTLVIQILPNN